MNKNDQDVGTGLVGAPGKQFLLIPPLPRRPHGVLEAISVRIRRKPCSYQIEYQTLTPFKQQLVEMS